MIPTPITIDGKSGTVVYLDAKWHPVTPAHATMARVLFDDGSSAFFTTDRGVQKREYVRDEKGQFASTDTAIGIIHQGVVRVRDLKGRDPYDAEHRQYWQTDAFSTERFRYNHGRVEWLDKPNADDYFAVDDYFAKKKWPVKGHYGQVHGDLIPPPVQSIAKYDPSQPRQPKGSAQGGEFASKAPILQGVDSKANAKAQIEKHLAFHKDVEGKKPDAATLKAAEDELRALPLVHGTTIYGALGAATDGLMSHQEMQKQAMKLVDEADGLREEINERWPSPEDDDSWPDNIEDIRSQMGLGQSEAEEMLGMIQELESVEKVLHGTTFPEDTKAGLDQFVFMTHGEKHQDYGNIAVIIDNEVIQDGWATERDINQTPGVSLHRPKEGLKNAEYAGIENYQATIVKGDDYYAVAAAKAGSTTAVANRSRDQLFEMKAPRVPKSAVKGFVVEDDYETAQRLADKLAEKGITNKVLYVSDKHYRQERVQHVQAQLKAIQATGMWDDDALAAFEEDHANRGLETGVTIL